MKRASRCSICKRDVEGCTYLVITRNECGKKEQYFICADCSCPINGLMNDMKRQIQTIKQLEVWLENNPDVITKSKNSRRKD